MNQGYQVIRVEVSDMKGGVASQTQLLSVGNTASLNKSVISGNVMSSKGSLQGAKVVLEKAPVINHTVSVQGTYQGSNFPSSQAEPLRYLIDGETKPDLNFERGEITSFLF